MVDHFWIQKLYTTLGPSFYFRNEMAVTRRSLVVQQNPGSQTNSRNEIYNICRPQPCRSDLKNQCFLQNFRKIVNISKNLKKKPKIWIPESSISIRRIGHYVRGMVSTSYPYIDHAMRNLDRNQNFVNRKQASLSRKWRSLWRKWPSLWPKWRSLSIESNLRGHFRSKWPSLSRKWRSLSVESDLSFHQSEGYLRSKSILSSSRNRKLFRQPDLQVRGAADQLRPRRINQ